MKQRDISLDVSKAIGIFLVVFLHVRVYGLQRSVLTGQEWADNFASVSCLPVFFMLGGAFSLKWLESADWRKLLVRVVGLIWPVLSVFVVLGPLIGFVVYGKSSVTSPMAFVRELLSSGWFFFGFSLCYLVTFAAFIAAHGRKFFLALILIGIYFGLWLSPYGLFHIVETLPFFWFGLFVYRRLNESRYGFALGLGSFVSYVAICALSEDFFKCGLMFHSVSMPLLSFTWRGMGLMAARISLGVIGALGIMSLARIIVKVAPTPAGWLSLIGKETLGVFFVHTQLLPIGYDCGWWDWCGAGLAGRLVISFLVLIVSYLTVLAINRSWWLQSLVWNPLPAFNELKSIVSRISPSRNSRQQGGER